MGLMMAVMGGRMLVFALAALGVISWGGSAGTSFMLLVMIPMLVIVVMMRFGRKGMAGHSMSGGSHETPVELLQKRYVRGELTRDAYEEMKRALVDDTPRPPSVEHDERHS